MTNVARWAVLGPLFLIPFLALYISDSLFFPFITGKNFGFRILVEIALAGWIVLAIADRRYRPKWSWVLGSFGVLVAWMLIADLLAINTHKALWSNFERMDGFVTLAHVFALFVIAGSVLTVDKLWRRWWLTFIAATALVIGYGLLQFMGLAEIHQSDTRLDATLGNSEYLAGYLLLALGITLWQAFATKAGEKKWLRNSLFVLAALEVLVLLGTGTRGTAIALVAASVFGGLLWAFESGKRGRKGAAIFLGTLVVLVGGFYAIRDSGFVQSDPNLSRIANISISDLDTRFTVWGMAVEGIKERPITGWGQEGYNYIFNTYFEPSLYGQEPWFDRAHNIYLDWAVSGGIPALLLFLFLGGSTAVAIYRARELEPWERVILLSALAAYAIQGLAVFDNLFTYVPMAMLLAYAHSLRARPIARLEDTREVKGVALETIVAPVALVLALLLIYTVNIPTYAASKDLIRGLSAGSVDARLEHFQNAIEHDPFATQEIREQLLQFAQSVAASKEVSSSEREEVVSYAREQIEKEIARAPEDARLYILYASFLRGVGDFAAAREQSAIARTLSPNKQAIMIEQGIEAWQDEDPETAQAFFNEAYALAPTNDELAIYAAAGHVISGDIPGAKTLLNDHFGTTTVGHMVLAVAYQQVGAWSDLVALMRVRVAQEQDAASGYQLAAALAQAGRLAEARAQVRETMEAFPESSGEGSALLLQLGGR